MTYAILIILLAPSWTWNPALAALFTPPRPEVGRYEAYTSPAAIETLAGPASIEKLAPLDAFGTAGPYDRAALARLYGGRQVMVAHAWTRAGETFESVTYLSPYPDPSLTHLNGGTLMLRWIGSAPDTLRRSP